MNAPPLLLAAALVAGAAQAASTASSAASDSASSAASSTSESLKGSSASSASAEERLALQGDYRVGAMVGVAGRPDRVQLQLEPVRAGQGRRFGLQLPQRIAEQAAIGTGTVVVAKARPYGLEFALAAAPEPFFLVVDDAVLDELAPRPVTL